MADFNTKAVPKTDSMFGYDPALAHKSHTQFIRGVVWADDPEGLLFDKPQRHSPTTARASCGTEHFKEGKQGKFDTLTARSHFGDLQFFHGMASSDKEAPKTTKAHMLNWARFLVNVATGATLTFTKLKDVAEVSALFPKLGGRTVKELFGWGAGHFEDIRQRAVSALFHMIHYSCAGGHVERNSAGEIEQVPRISGQDRAQARRAGLSSAARGSRNLEESAWSRQEARSALSRRVRDCAADDRGGRLSGDIVGLVD